MSDAGRAAAHATAGQSGQAGGALRARVLAGLARVLAWHQIDLPRAAGLADGAVAAARAAGDPRLVASCLIAQHNAHWQPGNPADRRDIAVAAAACAREAGDQELLAEARLLIATDLLELADPAFRAELSGFLDLAGTAPEPRLRYAALTRRAMLALLGGQLAEAERLIGEAAAAGRDCGDPGADDVRIDQSWDLLPAQGRLDELAGVAAGMFPDPDSTQARGLRAWILLARGDQAQAAGLMAPELSIGSPGGPPPPPPAGRQWLLGAAFGAELIAELGDQPGVQAAAEGLYQALAPFTGLAVVSGAAISFRGAVAHHRGALALAAGRAEEAAALLAQAAATHEGLGAEAWRLRSSYLLARAWLTLGEHFASPAPAGPDVPGIPAAPHHQELASLRPPQMPLRRVPRERRAWRRATPPLARVLAGGPRRWSCWPKPRLRPGCSAWTAWPWPPRPPRTRPGHRPPRRAGSPGTAACGRSPTPARPCGCATPRASVTSPSCSAAPASRSPRPT